MNIRKEFIKEKGYSYFNNTVLNEYSIWLENKLIDTHKTLQNDRKNGNSDFSAKNTNIMIWYKLEEQLPPKNTLVLVRRFPNKIENEPIYFAMREDKELATNPDASRDCYWFGNHKNNFLSEQESSIKLDVFSNFSDVTVKDWAFIDIVL